MYKISLVRGFFKWISLAYLPDCINYLKEDYVARLGNVYLVLLLVFRKKDLYSIITQKAHIPWNPADFRWNPVNFTMKSGGFHEIREIRRISGEIRQVSPRYHLWNPPKIIKASVSAKTLQFDECRVGDFTCEIQWISPRFHLWNPPKVIKASVSAKTLQFDECRVGAMTKDFMKSTRFDPWNLADFTCEIHPNYKSKCFSKNSSVWWMQGRGYDQGFHEIHQISPMKSGRFHLWNPPKL